MSASTFVVLGDCHFPFANSKAIAAAGDLIKRTQPNYVIQIGDLYDMYSFSRFPKNPNFIKPDEELDLGRAMALDMWDMIKRACPKAHRVQLYGNHDHRPVKMIKEMAPATYSIIKKFVKESMSFPGVELVDDEHEIEDIVFMHGFRKSGEHARWNQQSTVVGHTHKPGVTYDQNKNGPFWELNVAWLGDHESEAFTYAAQRRLHKMINGCGVIDALGPRFVQL